LNKFKKKTRGRLLKKEKDSGASARQEAKRKRPPCLKEAVHLVVTDWGGEGKQKELQDGNK